MRPQAIFTVFISPNPLIHIAKSILGRTKFLHKILNTKTNLCVICVPTDLMSPKRRRKTDTLPSKKIKKMHQKKKKDESIPIISISNTIYSEHLFGASPKFLNFYPPKSPHSIVLIFRHSHSPMIHSEGTNIIQKGQTRAPFNTGVNLRVQFCLVQIFRSFQLGSGVKSGITPSVTASFCS